MTLKVSEPGLVPPDGGWGWVVALAYGLNNIVVLPLISQFGLVFQRAFEETGISGTEGALIINLNHGFGMLLSFFGGPTLRRFGYRKVAIVGSLFVAFGVILTAKANGFWMFIFAYSIMSSIGIAAVMAAFTLAINAFFKEKRTKAIGLGMSLTGLGAIFMPLIMDALIREYGWRYAVLTLGGLCLHSLIASLLLRPAKWYLKKPTSEPEEMVPLNKKTEDTEDKISSKPHLQVLNDPTVISSKSPNGQAKLPDRNSYFGENLENYLEPKSISMRSLNSNASLHSRNAISHPDIRKEKTEQTPGEPGYKWWESQEINLGSSVNIFHEQKPEGKLKEQTKEDFQENGAAGCVKIKKAIVDFFDLTLLKDKIFVNILIGLSIAACAEINFSLLLPLILNNTYFFDTNESAIIMAVIGVFDLLFRMVSPFIGDRFRKTPRVMYLISILLIVFVRTIMLFVTTFKGMLFIAMGIGVTKGIRTVYMNVVIPSYVPIDRLPFASGIQMFVNGVIIVIFGPILGKVKDVSGSYKIPLIIINCVSMITVFIWTIEFIITRTSSRRQQAQPDPPA